MSKLAENLKARKTGILHERIMPLNQMMVEDGFVYMDCLFNNVQYRVEVIFGAEFSAPVENENAFSRALYDTRALIVNEVFGEFREPLYLLKEALNNQDIDKSKKIAHDIFHKMFVDGI